MRPLKHWIERITHYLERLDMWLDRHTKPKINLLPEKICTYMQGRIIYCANCECNSTLWRHQGRICCSVCGSIHWDCPGSNLKIVYIYKEN